MKRLLPAVIAAGLAGQLLFAQGMDTRAKATDWEEINFEFNQAVMVDGFPSLLRLAEMLKQHTDYKVNLVGNADAKGSNRYNDQLSLKRANTVAQFLQKYGANSSQIQVKGDGKRNPEANNGDKNGRFINRRVVVTVTAPDGTVIGDGSMASAINDFEKYTRGQLSKIDDLLSQLKQMETELQGIKADTGQIAGIKSDTGEIKSTTTSIKSDTTDLVARPKPLTREETTEIAQNAANYALTQSALRNRKYSLVGGAIGPVFGPGRTGNFSAEVFGKTLIPFGNGKTPDMSGTHAVQIDGEWIYFHKNKNRLDGRSDGIFNVGLVERINHLQVGGFMQWDYVNFNVYQGGGLLGAGIATVDYVFNGGSIGVFGGKGFRNIANIGTTSLGGPALVPPAYVRYEDQVGFHALGALGTSAYVESSVALKQRIAANRTKYPSATVKLVIPSGESFAFYLQGDYNTTFQNIGGNAFRATVGLEFGNWLRPAKYGTTTGPVPVSVPHPHYELIQR